METERLLTIAVMNAKGGSGKTTIATNLANYYAGHDLKTLIVDHDSQGSSTQWQKRRNASFPGVDVTEAFRQPTNYTRTWLMRVPMGTKRVLIDTPAGIETQQMENVAKRADVILVPVLPSPIDIQAVSDFIARLSKSVWVKSGQTRVAVIANRARHNTKVFEKLQHFLSNLDVPFIATLRDTQNYIHASELGSGIHSLSKNNAQRDIGQWQSLIDWLENAPKDLTPVPNPVLGLATRN